VGGLVGYLSTDIANCFWDTQTSGTSDGVGSVNPDPAGVTGKTTAEMKTLSTYTLAEWDFSATDGDPADWWMPANGYPQLAWQPIIADIASSYGVNFVDYAALVAHWGQTGCPTSCGSADLSGDGTVNIGDLRLFADSWLAGM